MKSHSNFWSAAQPLSGLTDFNRLKNDGNPFKILIGCLSGLTDFNRFKKWWKFISSAAQPSRTNLCRFSIQRKGWTSFWPVLTQGRALVWPKFTRSDHEWEPPCQTTLRRCLLNVTFKERLSWTELNFAHDDRRQAELNWAQTLNVTFTDGLSWTELHFGRDFRRKPELNCAERCMWPLKAG